MALLLSFIFIFINNMPLVYAASSTVMNRGQEGSLLKLHTEEGYWKIEDDTIVKQLSAGVGEIYGKDYDYIRIKALKTGITNVRFYNNSGRLLAIESVEVVTPIESIKLSESKLTMCVNDTKGLTVNINPIDADYQDIYLESSDSSIVKVDNKGNLTALREGNVTITAKTGDDKNSDTCIVDVIIPTSSISIGNEEISMTSRLDKVKLDATVYPENATDKSLLYESSNEDIVRVDEDGHVEAIGNGEAIITIKAKDGFSKTTKKVVVNGLVESITLNKSSIELYNNEETFNAKATINPSNALDKTVIWTSSDTNVAVVDKNGVIKGKEPGNCIITATSGDGKISRDIKVTVNKLLQISFAEISEYGDNYYSYSTILPDKYCKQNSVIALEIPKKRGYSFLGWYKDFSKGNYIDLIKDNKFTVTQEQAIFAKFKPIKVESIELTSEYISSDGVNEFIEIGGKFTPSYVANGKFKITSSNTKVAEPTHGSRTAFDQEDKNIIMGTLKIKGPGTTTITVTSEDGNKVATKKIKIVKESTGHSMIMKDLIPEFKLSMTSDKCVKITFPYYEGAMNYEIIRRDSLGNSWSFYINDPKQGSYIDKEANKANVTYSYQMKVNYGGSVITDYSPVSKVKLALSKPTIKASSNSYNSIKLSINKVINAKEYKIYRSVNNKSWSYLGKTKELSYTDTKLSFNKNYYYKVVACNGSMNSSYSSVVSAKTKLKTTKAEVSSSHNSNKLSWNKISGAGGYAIYRSSSKDGKYTLVKTITSGSTTSYVDSGLVTGKNYYYKVKSYRVVSGKKIYSSYSSVVNGKPKLATPNVSLSIRGSKVTAKWNKIDGAKGYQIYRKCKGEDSYTLVKTITKGSTVSYTDSNIKSNNKYYYKVRAYKIINGKKVYSSYSSTKSIEV